ncbi:MAG: serine/threonine protein kinase [bacterium]
MLKFKQPPKEYDAIFLEDTDRPLPEKLNPSTRYMFLSTLAKGGKSIIRTCRDMHLSRVVVYKSLRSEFIDDPIEQRRLLREARVMALLQHPNTVPVYEIGRDRSGRIYFTMKLVHGYTLREIMEYRDRYDLTQLIEVIEQVAQALNYAHDHGVAHRDLKPENILAGPYGEVLLFDWGLAKVWRKDGTTLEEPESGKVVKGSSMSLTGHGKLQGTPIYMSPEQIRRDPDISYSTDVYSLGVVLYELLTGRVPFNGEHTYEVIEAVENEQPAAPSSISKFRVPKMLEDLAMRCLRKDPGARPSMKEVIQILQQDWARELFRS